MSSVFDLMEKMEDPKVRELSARYENARIATDMAYRLACGNVGFAHSDFQERVTTARAMKVEIEKDLNATLGVLEEAHEPKSDTAKVSRPS